MTFSKMFRVSRGTIRPKTVSSTIWCSRSSRRCKSCRPISARTRSFCVAPILIRLVACRPWRKRPRSWLTFLGETGRLGGPSRRQRRLRELLDVDDGGHPPREHEEAERHRGVQIPPMAVRGGAVRHPMDKFAKELLTARGSALKNPAAAYWRASRDPLDATETTAQLFLGIRIQCAKCHNTRSSVDARQLLRHRRRLRAGRSEARCHGGRGNHLHRRGGGSDPTAHGQADEDAPVAQG